MASTQENKPAGVTKQLSQWLEKFSWDDIPEDVRTRAKYIILDGLACAIVGSHLPWTEKAAETIFEMEPTGNSTIWGYTDKVRITVELYHNNLTSLQSSRKSVLYQQPY